MFEQTTGLGKFAPWKTKKIESYVRTLSLKVPREATRRLGDVQGLIGTMSDVRTGDLLAANIEEAFSDGLDEALKKLPVSASFEATFESVVARINLMLQRLLGDRGLSIENSDVHGVIIAQRGREVAAAVWGKPSLILFRRGMEGGPKLFNVLEAEAENQQAPMTGTGGGFNNLISGKISGKDRMVIANRNLLELLDKKCLQEILSVPRTDTVTMLLRDALVSRHENLNLAMLLLDGYAGGEASLAKQQPDTEAAEADAAPAKSLRERQVEAATAPNDDLPENVLAPQPTPRTKNELTLAHRTSAMKKMLVGAKKALGQTAVVTAKSMKSAGGAVAVHGRKAIVVSFGAGKTLGGLMFKAMTVEGEETEGRGLKVESGKWKVESRELKVESDLYDLGGGRPESPHEERSEKKVKITNLKEMVAMLVPKLRALGGQIVARFRALPTKSQRLFYAAAALVLLFAFSVIAIGVRRSQENATASYEKAVSEIRQQIDSAEASMIYRDEARARRLLEEAAAAITLLPEKSEDQAATKLQLTQDMSAKFAGLRHAVALDAPEVLSTVVTQTGSPDLRTLAAVGTSLWAAASDGTVFRIFTEDGTATAVHTLTGGVAPKIFTALSSGVLMGGEDGLVSISSGGQVTTQALSAGEFELGFSDATVFGSRLYLLDAAHNRILKFASVSGGFSSPQVYVKDGTDLSGAVSLTIDGTVFVLNANGGIAKLLSGKSESFTADTINPPLVSPTLIRTANAESDLYVLDTGRPRVARFDKESGHLVAQYESDGLQGVTSIQVDEAARTILATKGNQVLRFMWKEDE